MGNAVVGRQLDTTTVTYPESDGKPLGENTEQVEWIVKLYVILRWMFRDLAVFVAADLFWYPVLGNNQIVQAPDVMVVFGRPKGKRSSYQQWQEGGIGPQVVFEIRSPSNKKKHMEALLAFYQTYGVDEYYVYDPQRKRLKGYERRADRLCELKKLDGWVSPRLGIRFVTSAGAEPEVYMPDGTLVEAPEELLASYVAEVEAQRRRADDERRLRMAEKQRADKAEQLAEEQKQILEEKSRIAEEKSRIAEEKSRIAEELAAELARLRAQMKDGAQR